MITVADFAKASSAEKDDLARELNSEFLALDADLRLTKAYEAFGSGLIATSSFGRDAALLLHHLYRLQLPLRVFFIDTGFHFEDTLAYRHDLANQWKLKVIDSRGTDPNPRRYAVMNEGQLSITDIDACCAINKVAAQRAFLASPDVTAFVSGLRRDQSDTRTNTPFAQVQKGRIKICPFADWPQDQVEMYLKLWETPEHPLAALGYTSIGCSPVTCTAPPIAGADGRSGRWMGQDKTECGLHLDMEP